MIYKLETVGEYSANEFEVIHRSDNLAQIYVCDAWTCHSICLTKSNVSDLIDALVKMKEVMHD